jgi:hypothetical protein
VVAYTLFYNNAVDAEQSMLGAGIKFGQNPLFAYAPNAGPDGIWRTADDDFRGLIQLPGSPAIDAGYDPICPATDLLGAIRPQGAHCDIGAFEGSGTAPTPTPIPVRPPVATTLVSPSGNITNPTPTYTWNAVLNGAQGDAATWYLLRVKKADNTVVISQWYQASSVCPGSTCSIQNSTALTGGVFTWEVQTWNNGGYGPWSSPMSFTLPFLPGQAVVLSPSGAITDITPTFSWNVSPDGTTTDPASWYYLWIDGPSGNVFAQWHKASAICNASTCSVTPPLTLGGGNHTWWVQTWNSTGYGPWSAGMGFSLPVPKPPVAATLVAPSGSITNTTPAYTWDAVLDSPQGDAATWYYLWVDGPSGNVIQQWYQASAVCIGATCSITPATTLNSGAHVWWVQTWNPTGYGPWSSGMNFTVGP